MNQKEGRQEFTKKFVETLASGYVLTIRDLKEDAPRFGFSETTVSSMHTLLDRDLYDAFWFDGDKDQWLVKADPDSLPIKIIDTKYRRRQIIYAIDINSNDTDLDRVKAQIDREIKFRRRK